MIILIFPLVGFNVLKKTTYNAMLVYVTILCVNIFYLKIYLKFRSSFCNMYNIYMEFDENKEVLL
jgi:hypothetical protein